MSEVPSPCINVCRMDEASGLCEGCLRTLDEIAAWGSMSDPARQALRLQLRHRRQAQRQARQTAAAARPR